MLIRSRIVRNRNVSISLLNILTRGISINNCFLINNNNYKRTPILYIPPTFGIRLKVLVT
jgi:hypothetical protein